MHPRKTSEFRGFSCILSQILDSHFYRCICPFFACRMNLNLQHWLSHPFAPAPERLRSPRAALFFCPFLTQTQTTDKPKTCPPFRIFQARSFAKDFGLFLFHEKGAIQMYFTSKPSLNSMEAIIQRPPGGNQRGGGRIRRAYPFRKTDCDCRLCLYYRKKKD